MPIVSNMKDMGFSLQPTIKYEEVGKVYVKTKQEFPTTGTSEMDPITEKSPEMVTEFIDFK